MISDKQFFVLLIVIFAILTVVYLAGKKSSENSENGRERGMTQFKMKYDPSSFSDYYISFPITENQNITMLVDTGSAPVVVKTDQVNITGDFVPIGDYPMDNINYLGIGAQPRQWYTSEWQGYSFPLVVCDQASGSQLTLPNILGLAEKFQSSDESNTTLYSSIIDFNYISNFTIDFGINCCFTVNDLEDGWDFILPRNKTEFLDLFHTRFYCADLTIQDEKIPFIFDSGMFQGEVYGLELNSPNAFPVLDDDETVVFELGPDDTHNDLNSVASPSWQGYKFIIVGNHVLSSPNTSDGMAYKIGITSDNIMLKKVPARIQATIEKNEYRLSVDAIRARYR